MKVHEQPLGKLGMLDLTEKKPNSMRKTMVLRETINSRKTILWQNPQNNLIYSYNACEKLWNNGTYELPNPLPSVVTEVG